MAMTSGVKINLGGTDYILPPLNCEALEQFGDQLETLNDQPLVKKIGITVDLTLACLSRNYPEIKRDEVARFIDLSNMSDVIAVIMGVSGLEKIEGEAKGKAKK